MRLLFPEISMDIVRSLGNDGFDEAKAGEFLEVLMEQRPLLVAFLAKAARSGFQDAADLSLEAVYLTGASIALRAVQMMLEQAEPPALKP